MGTDSRTIVNQFRNEFSPALSFRISDGSIPVQNSGPKGVGIEMALQMRIKTLPGDHIRNTIAVQIGEGGRMRFRERHIPGVFGRKIAHDVVVHERNGSRVVTLLLKPGKSPSVRCNRRHDVGQAITVYVVDTHLSPTIAECCLMIFPDTIFCTLCGLFPPAAAVHDIHATVPVYVAYAHPMGSSKARFGNVVYG